MASTRAQVVTRRTYNRPLNAEGTKFETWEQTIGRVIAHQKWLWERAKGEETLTDEEWNELEELQNLLLTRKAAMAGRTLWLGDTEISRKRESSMFNCSFTIVETIYDIVDVLWLLLQGCGVGFKPITGTLNGFYRPIEDIRVIHTKRTGKGGIEDNMEDWDPDTKIWTITIGDSAEAWARSVGKLLAGKYPAKTLILDFSQIRPAGERLKGYGWISSGSEAIGRAYLEIAKILNLRAGNLLRKMDILDIVNWLGTVLSSRRSAEIALFDYGEPEWHDFAVGKKDWWLTGNEQRQQSNNSLLFRYKPKKEELANIFELMADAGGSEPGFINGMAALERAPWFKGVNPCAEILLGNKTFCNLTEIDLGKFVGDQAGLIQALKLVARANYRQTCVDLNDGVLQEAWHLNNQFLHLCGVGLTGIARRRNLGAYDYKQMQRVTTSAAYRMADELDLPRPKNVTTVKPSGTLSKIMDTTEGVHKPLGKYILNNINFSKHDPLIDILRSANYNVFDHPSDPEGVLATFPVNYEDVEFDKEGGKDVNLETAIQQLERYKLIQNNWCQQNVSATISYSPDEVDGIVDWLYSNWDQYVGVSFIYRNDPTKTAKDLGYLYLPQEVVTKQEYENYTDRLLPIDLESANTFEEIKDEECATGACPIK
jgi:ribonucleoside-triphosphate reductase